jgi:hypothetical protein
VTRRITVQAGLDKNLRPYLKNQLIPRRPNPSRVRKGSGAEEALASTGVPEEEGFEQAGHCDGESWPGQPGTG